MEKNDITGDALVSKPTTKAYEDGWERIYGTTRTVVDSEKKEKITKFINPYSLAICKLEGQYAYVIVDGVKWACNSYGEPIELWVDNNYKSVRDVKSNSQTS